MLRQTLKSCGFHKTRASKYAWPFSTLWLKGLNELISISYNSSVTRQKGESQNGGNKKTKHEQFSQKNEHFLSPDRRTYL